MRKTALHYEREDTAKMMISMFIKEDSISNHFNFDILGITDPNEMKSKKENEYLEDNYFQETVLVNKSERLWLEQVRKAAEKGGI